MGVNYYSEELRLTTIVSDLCERTLQCTLLQTKEKCPKINLLTYSVYELGVKIQKF